MSKIVEFAKRSNEPPEIGSYRDTPTARNITRSLDLINLMPGCGMTMISGASGVGKTMTLRRYVKQNENSFLFTAAAGESKPFALAQMLCRPWFLSSQGLSLTALRTDLMKAMKRGRYVFVVDEAQHLAPDALEWLRALCEGSSTDLVLVGDLRLAVTVQRIEQLQSRMRRPVKIQQASQEDVALLAAGTGFDTIQMIDLLHSVAKLKGGLRNVENVLRLAVLFAGEDAPDLIHIKAAIEDMNLARKGA